MERQTLQRRLRELLNLAPTMRRAEAPDYLFGRLRLADRLLVLGAIGLMVAATGTINLMQADPDLLFVWLSFCLYAVVIAAPFVFYRPSWGPLHPIVFTVLWWGLVRHALPRLGVFATGLEYHRAISPSAGINSNLVVIHATLLNAIGILSLYCGYLATRRVTVPKIVFGPPRHLGVKVVLIAFVSFGAFFLLLVEAGGLDALLLQRGLTRDQRLSAALGGAHWHFLTSLIETAWLVWLALRPSSWRSPLFWAIGASSLFVGFAVTGSRGGIVVPLIMALMIRVLSLRSIPRGALLLLAIGALFAIGVLGEFRRQSFKARGLDDIHLDGSADHWLARGIDNFVDYGVTFDGSYAVLANVPDRSEFLYGRSYTSVLLAPVPSALLPFDKPPAGGRLLSSEMFNNPLNAIPPGVVGEAYWNFWVPGVILVMFLSGAFLKWIMHLYRAHNGAGWVMPLYVITLIRFQPASDDAYKWLHAIIPTILLILFFCGLPKWRRQLSAPSSSETDLSDPQPAPPVFQ